MKIESVDVYKEGYLFSGFEMCEINVFVFIDDSRGKVVVVFIDGDEDIRVEFNEFVNCVNKILIFGGEIFIENEIIGYELNKD